MAFLEGLTRKRRGGMAALSVALLVVGAGLSLRNGAAVEGVGFVLLGLALFLLYVCVTGRLVEALNVSLWWRALKGLRSAPGGVAMFLGEFFGVLLGDLLPKLLIALMVVCGVLLALCLGVLMLHDVGEFLTAPIGFKDLPRSGFVELADLGVWVFGITLAALYGFYWLLERVAGPF